MKIDRIVNGQYFVARAITSTLFLLAASANGFAQQGVMPVGPRIDPEAARIRGEQQRELQLRNNGTEKGHTDDRAVKAAAEQLGQDFKRIQIIRNDMAHALKDGGVLDYRRITGETTEVKKRALRMQGYLALRTPEDESKEQAGEEVKEYDEAQIKGALVMLCKRIDSFVANPRFTSPGVIDVNGTTRARRDLQQIIALSDGIKGSAEKLGQKNK